MKNTKKRGMSMLSALAVAFLLMGSFVVVLTATTKPSDFSIPKVSADDGEDGGDDSGDSGDKEDNESKDKQDENKKESEKKAKEAAKEKAKREQERIKKEAELIRQTGKTSFDSENESEDGVESENESGDDNGTDQNMDNNEGDQNDDTAGDVTKENESVKKLNEKRAEIFKSINEEIIKAEERIAEAEAEGLDVSAAKATLEQAKAKEKVAEETMATGDMQAAIALAREVRKLSHFARNQQLHTAEKISEAVSKVGKRITQTEGKIALYVSLGGDGSAFTSQLNVVKSDFEAAKSLIAQGGDNITTGLTNLDAVERKVKAIKNSVETALYALGGTDERYDNDYENESEDVYKNLKDVAEIEGEDAGEKVKTVAESQRESAKKVGEVVKSIDERNPALQLLLGTKQSDLDQLNTEITNNEARIATLSDAANSIQDPDLKSVVTDQIETLKQETLKLKTFVSGQKNRISAFGWFFNLF